MAEMDGKIKKWGNSGGLVMPMDFMKKNKLKFGEDVHVIVIKKSNVLRETFGTFKFKESAQKIKDDLRKELYDD